MFPVVEGCVCPASLTGLLCGGGRRNETPRLGSPLFSNDKMDHERPEFPINQSGAPDPGPEYSVSTRRKVFKSVRSSGNPPALPRRPGRSLPRPAPSRCPCFVPEVEQAPSHRPAPQQTRTIAFPRSSSASARVDIAGAATLVPRPCPPARLTDAVVIGSVFWGRISPTTPGMPPRPHSTP